MGDHVLSPHQSGPLGNGGHGGVASSYPQMGGLEGRRLCFWDTLSPIWGFTLLVGTMNRPL